MAWGWQNSCRPRSCNYLQNVGATTYKNFLQFYAKKACKKQREVRDRVLEKDGGIDVYLFMIEGRIVVADTAHHIIPLRDDWSMRNDIDNLISLHHDTHSLIEQMYRNDKEKAQRMLQKLLKEYREKG